MPRPRKIETDVVLKIIYEYFQVECSGDVKKLKYKRIAEYAENKGYPIKEHDIRRNSEVRSYIEKLKDVTKEHTHNLSPVYRCMNISEFLNLHKNKTSLEKALFELDEYWKGIYDTMIVIQTENKKLTTEIEKLRTIVTDNEEIKLQSEKVENENRGLTVENRYLKKMLRTYLYPEVAERIINDKAETMTSVNAERLPEYADTDEVPGSFDAAIKHDTALKRDENILISRIRRLCDEEQ